MVPGARFASGHGDRPDRFVLTEHRYGHPAVIATRTGAGSHRLGDSRIALHVGGIDRSTLANGLGVRQLRVQRLGEYRSQRGISGVIDARVGGELDLITGEPGQRTRMPPQQSHGAGENRVEHRLACWLNIESTMWMNAS